MLVLSRKDSEQILIDGEICIRVLSIRGNTVRLGIEAPAEVAIRRAEIKSTPRVAEDPANLKPTQPSELSREALTQVVAP